MFRYGRLHRSTLAWRQHVGLPEQPCVTALTKHLLDEWKDPWTNGRKQLQEQGGTLRAQARRISESTLEAQQRRQ